MASFGESRITFLGTGGGRIVIANQIRGTGGFVINLQGHQIHVDPGPGALVRVNEAKLRPSATDILFVSHGHIDHANDINALADAMTLGGIHKRGTLISTPSVIKGSSHDTAWLHRYYEDKLRMIHALRPGDSVNVGELKFIATTTQHDEDFAIGFRLEASGIIIGYTSDTAYCKELVNDLKGCRVLIINVLRPGKDRWKTHLCTEDAIKLVESVRPELAIIQHYGAKMIRANPLYEAREIQQQTGVRTIAADDGLVVDLSGLVKKT